ncbi:MAG: acyl-CoA dehydrogenase family protein [Acidobacteriota bacterium]|nr:acyl-CoA/acyl-ACP dehydrogenase [Blastocatellia bacterium]MDW8240899.1 acyl-CoA dehydrogenase family protein [Acidobacteriota bacterium]
MEFGFTEEQQMIRQQAAECLKHECPTGLVRQLMESEHGYSHELWQTMVEMGWTGLIIPEAYGGVGLSFVELAIVLEEMGRALVPGSFFSTVVLAGQVLLAATNDQQKQCWLVPLASGKLRATVAATESNGRWDAGGITVRAEHQNGQFLINGTKLFVPDAHIADLIICVARTGSMEGVEQGITLFAVNRHAPGLTVTPLKTLDQTRRLYEVSFEQVQVPAHYVLGEVGQGWTIWERVFDKATIGLCAEMVGGAQAALDMAVNYSKSRIQFGRPIGSFQSLQHRCADMLLLTESARSAVYAAAWVASQDANDLSLQASIAKSYTNDAYRYVTGECIQIHGGMGFTWEHDAHLYLKRAKADEVTFGDAAFHRERIAKLIGL